MPRSHPIVSVLLSLGLALLGSQTLAADFTGRVVGVADGDTITVGHSSVHETGTPRQDHGTAAEATAGHHVREQPE